MCRAFGLTVLLFNAVASPAPAADPAVMFRTSGAETAVYDFVEIEARVSNPSAKNPFADAILAGTFRLEGGEPVKVDGFCDSEDGSVYRIRFMPTRPGNYEYEVVFTSGSVTRKYAGSFAARDAKRKGLVRVDREHPWHFLWEGTGEHYFWNGMTTYWLAGWTDEKVIRDSIDRLARHKVNRLRVALCGRTTGGERWDENLVVNTDAFKFRLEPWPPARPDDVANPGYDVTRFNVPFWQKYERLLRYARDRDMVVSVIFYLDGADPGVDPFGKAKAGSPEERAYYRYGVSRLAAFSNVTWDVTNEYHLFRDEAWVNATGTFVKEIDPYDHIPASTVTANTPSAPPRGATSPFIRCGTPAATSSCSSSAPRRRRPAGRCRR